MNRDVFIGIDPGKDGGIVIKDGNNYEKITMPVHKVETGDKLKSGKPKTKTEFNERGFRQIILDINKRYKDCNFIGAIEEVTGRTGWSAQNNFNFGHTAGLQRMIFIMLKVDYISVRPAKWQSYVRQGYPDLKKKSSSGKTMVSDPKATALMIVEKEFPHIDFRKTERSKVPHDGLIDAFLICLYRYRTYNNQK